MYFAITLDRRDYKSFDEVPGHSRWRHFEAGGLDRVKPLVQNWKDGGVDSTEVARRLVDLAVVSVLLDAGAGAK